MKLKAFKISIISLILLLAVSASCMAMGLGVYVGYDFLLSSLGWYDNWSNFDRVKIIQAGMLFDTNVAQDRLFNYRLQIGLDFSNATFYDQDRSQSADMNIWQLSFCNTFGFGFVRNEMVRFWVGPQVGFGLGFEPNFLQKGYYSEPGDFFEFDFFAGVGLGINIHLGDTVSLFADAGLRLHEDFMMSPAAAFVGYLIKVHANVGVIFRFDDTYE